MGNFGTVKTLFDVGYVTLSVILSLLLFGWRVVGTREGTLIAAVGTGFVVMGLFVFLKGDIQNFVNIYLHKAVFFEIKILCICRYIK